jgi:hypothetical protein
MSIVWVSLTIIVEGLIYYYKQTVTVVFLSAHSVYLFGIALPHGQARALFLARKKDELNFRSFDNESERVIPH